ncbi:hypothetical protein [Azospirillum sp. ST 5-10]|uniref:hypothetical protein n=1 Tax=unclassified Azospirillum TaxID=2630922 RepID=UPI003F49B6D0
MSRLTRGEVALTLAGAEHTLKPSLNCYQRLATQYDNYGVLLGKIAAGNIPAIIFVLRHGLGFTDQQAKKLPQLVMDTGLAGLADPLSDFVFRLFNAGKSVDEVMADKAGPADLADAGGEAGGEDGADPLLAG